MLDLLGDLWPWLAMAAVLAATLAASGHAAIYKRDPRAAIAWVGLIWLAPGIGAALYALVGINRIRRKAVALRGGSVPTAAAAAGLPCVLPDPGLAPLVRLVDGVTRRTLTGGNRILPLIDGDEAYPCMLEAIEGARESVALSTYIFDHDAAGLRFVEALARARARGVAVRVLIDAVGARYSRASMAAALAARGVGTALFLPAGAWRLPYFNLRNHRKLLIVDGRLGFTGGMNLRVGHWLSEEPAHPVRDLQFQVEGPVVAHLREAFAEDWAFAAGERLEGASWKPVLPAAGATCARGLTDGPDEDFDVLRLTRLGALACARRSVWVITPYFVPDPSIVTGLNVAALRGVRVRILLPGVNNLPVVHWASRALWWQVLERGCELRLSPPPFDHSKLMLVDGAWSLFGACNWDARSLRLNFEFDVEAHDPALASRLEEIAEERWERARPVSLEEVDARGLPARLRDGAARLLAPFL